MKEQRMADHIEFSPGRIVVIRSDPSLRGTVMEVLPGEAEARVEIFVNGKVRTYYASQLQIEAQSDENVQPLSCEQFHASLTARQIRHPGLSTLYSLNASRVDFIPYQFRPVLRFIRSDRPRICSTFSCTKWFTHWNGVTPIGSTH